ncbi:MAG: HEPN domain-containing protein [Candidatus Omnitrophica bacterium]|nr:HEPN domain-containing protein [Candidatus Omnitrophota bacterium]
MIEEEIKKWLTKGLNDLKTAEILINLPEEEIVTDTLCFHCQQAVEKFLKAFLVASSVEFGRVHSIEYLIKLCEKIDKEFEFLYDITANLTDYAIDVRYPDEFYIPTIEEAKKAFESAQKVKEFIFKKLKISERDLK